MAKYSDIKGFTVQTVSSDPAASGIAAGSWASGGAINTGRSYGAGAGSTTAGIIFGGSEPSKSAKTESYNGSSWTEVNDMNTARAQMAPAIRAPYTAALIAGGEEPSISNKVESWDGSSWTETTEINTARRIAGGAGIQTSMLIFGGYVGPPAGPPGTTANTESWNGSAWTEVNNLNSGRYTLCGAGATNTAALAFGGSSPPYASITEQWDGSSWTEVSDLNTGRDEGMSAGIYTAALFIGGLADGAPYVTKTENWDGSSWTEIADLATGRAQGLSSAGTNTAAFVAGGNPGNLTSMEVFTAATTFSKQVEGQLYFNSTTNTFKETITDFAGASWATGGTLNTARYNAAGCGLQTAGLVFGGDSPAPGIFDETEEYNGTSWTEKNDLNTGRNRMGGSGTTTAGIAFGGDVPPATAVTERWDGSSWTEVADMNTARGEVAGGGGPAGYTAAIGATGRPSGNNATEIWDGSSWTEVNDTNTSSSVRRRLFGTTTAAIICGGGDTGTQTTVGANTESWDGTSWTEVNNLNSGRFEGAVCGIQTAGLFFGGSITPTPGYQKLTEQWDGTSWTERADLATAMTGNTAANSSPNAATFSALGGTPVVATTEEWTAGLANKTITSS